MKKILFTLPIFVILSGCATQQDGIAFDDSLITQYCFDSGKIGFETTTTLPETYLIDHPEVKAAINGVYWAADDGLPQGIVYHNGTHYASRKGLVSGYLVQDDDGIKVLEALDAPVEEYSLVIGTHPLLISDSQIHPQARLNRYNYDSAEELKYDYRSAIGTKNGNDICLAVSSEVFTMEEWARSLLSAGFTQAMNLDGGSSSQLAIKEKGVYGLGLTPTRLIIFAR